MKGTSFQTFQCSNGNLVIPSVKVVVIGFILTYFSGSSVSLNSSQFFFRLVRFVDKEGLSSAFVLLD